jgi:hypothetical protein
MPATPREIVNSAKQRIVELQATERDLNARIKQIKDKEREERLSSAEIGRLNELRSAKASVLAAIDDLAVVTMTALDQSDRLKHINNAIAGVVKDLKKTAARIAKIGAVAERIGNILSGVTVISNNIADLLKEQEG